MHRGEEQIEVK